MLQALTIWTYLSAIGLAVVLSDQPFIARAGGAGVWVAVSVGIFAWFVRGQILRWRARRGWVWLRGGRCSGCAYPVHRSWAQCPECGRRAGSPPGEGVVAGWRSRRPVFDTFNYH